MMNKKVTSILSYCTIIGWLVAYLAGDKENAKFHLSQGLTLGIVGLAFELIFGTVGFVLGELSRTGDLVGRLSSLLGRLNNLSSGLVGILVLMLIVTGIFNAAKEQEVPLPVIGKYNFLK